MSILLIAIYLIVGHSTAIVLDEYVENKSVWENILVVLLFPFVLIVIAFIVVLIPNKAEKK